MKRREFLSVTAGAGAAGVLVPRLAGAAAPPCPPPTLSVAGGSAIATTCISPPPGSAPAWFLAMQDGTWSTIAGGSGQTIGSHLPSPVPFNGPSQVAGDPSSITTAWTGGAVDQSRGEYILCANGGHADYPGNEAYALALRSATPGWRRLSDPTPNNLITFVDGSTGGVAINADGRPRSMHSSFECYADGKVWFPFQNSYASPAGGSAPGVVSFNRDALGNAASPLAWVASSLGAWAIYDPVNFAAIGYTDLSAMIFGVAAFDRVSHKIWALGGNSANYTIYWSVDTSGPTMGKSSAWSKGQSFGHWGSWVAVAHDLRILVAADHLRQVITVLDLTKAGQAGDWQQVSNVTGPGFFSQGAGGVYIQANHCIAAGNPVSSGNTIYRLKIPTKVVSGQTVYDPAGQWVWTALNPNGPKMSLPTGNGYAYSKWNIVEDMGNGQSAIVMLTDITGPTYVYKVPPTGI